MAIAGSKLGQFVSEQGFTETGAENRASDDVVVLRLRELGLVRPDVPDDAIRAVLQAARDEHAAGGYSPYNSPEERVRVFLEPHLSEKGQLWAVPWVTRWTSLMNDGRQRNKRTSLLATIG